jgi:hypothetical protein
MGRGAKIHASRWAALARQDMAILAMPFMITERESR